MYNIQLFRIIVKIESQIYTENIKLMKIDVVKAWVDDEKVYIQTKQGQVRSLDIASFRLLKKATPAQRQMFEVGKYGLHWPELDEDLSFEGFFSN
ncbi:Protein of unknown function [Bacteroides luti]|uniref:DUF2442 domain-containing protein n=2 Tax=Bacteroides luti TaxID=1297750 RepID=A0A1M5DLE0_9BACE|nr:Protein of unknown function [Bacteroides luti]